MVIKARRNDILFRKLLQFDFIESRVRKKTDRNINLPEKTSALNAYVFFSRAFFVLRIRRWYLFVVVTKKKNRKKIWINISRGWNTVYTFFRELIRVQWHFFYTTNSRGKQQRDSRQWWYEKINSGLRLCYFLILFVKFFFFFLIYNVWSLCLDTKLWRNIYIHRRVKFFEWFEKRKIFFPS